MTGLDFSKDLLIEIGVVITDADLNVIATQDSIVFHAEDSVLNGMDAWCLKHHGDSGLIDACKNSKITYEEADEQLLKFLQKYTTAGTLLQSSLVLIILNLYALTITQFFLQENALWLEILLAGIVISFVASFQSFIRIFTIGTLM